MKKTKTSSADDCLFDSKMPDHQTPGPWGSGQMPSLDGWRALSILLVLGSHCTHTFNFPAAWSPAFNWLFDGDLGVRCFFVISGFLITTLMLREAATLGRLDLKGFYIRRSIRILPVYFAFLAFAGLLQRFTAFELPARQWLHLLTFTANFSSIGTWLTGHTWSLSCEEQFYLLWPVSFVALGLTAPRKSAWILLLLIVASCPLWRTATYLQLFPGNPLFLRSSFFNYLDSLALGCLLAYLHPWIGRKLTGMRPQFSMGIAGLGVIVPHYLSYWLVAGMVTVPLGPLVQGAGLCWLISLSIHQSERGLWRTLNLRPVVWLGKLSYSLYLWQQFFCAKPDMFGWSSPWFQSFSWWLPASLAAAAASYYLLEMPLLSLRKRLHRC